MPSPRAIPPHPAVSSEATAPRGGFGLVLRTRAELATISAAVVQPGLSSQRIWLCSVLAACAGPTVEATTGEDPASAEPIRVILPRPPGDPKDPLSSFAVWQGWSMRWGYNHRFNRAGSLIEQRPCTDAHIRAGEPCRARLTLAAASGSGPDEAQLHSDLVLVAARNAGAATATREFVVRGLEGEPLHVTGDVRVPAGPGWRDLPHRVSLLSGLDVGSLGSADKMVHLAVKLRDPVDGPGGIRVPVRIDATFSCDSGECPPRDRVDMSFLVGVTVLAFRDSAVSTAEVEARTTYGWQKKEPLAPAATSTVVSMPAEGEAELLALRGFDVRLDQPLHVLEFGLRVESDRGRIWTELRNWRPGMRNSKRPYSFFAHARAGRVDWTVDLWRLEFRHAAVIRRQWQTEMRWRPRGRHAFDPMAERTRLIEWRVQP